MHDLRAHPPGAGAVREALHLRSSGRSGKDTIANLMEVIAGSYAHTINYSTLCEVAPGDGPSTTLSRMRARRIVSVRETASGEKHKMRADIYKRICDPFSKIIARPCFGTVNIVYSPQHLMRFCSNQPNQIDDSDEAVKARAAIIDHTAVFVDNPIETNESQRLDLSRDVLVARYRVGVFWLLQRVYRHFLHGRTDRNVRPVPEQCRESVSLDCAGKDQEWWPGFLSSLEPSPKSEVRHSRLRY